MGLTWGQWNSILGWTTLVLGICVTVVASLKFYVGRRVDEEKKVEAGQLEQKHREELNQVQEQFGERKLIQSAFAIESFKKYAGRKYFMSFVDKTEETRSLAGQIHFVLWRAGWKFMGLQECEVDVQVGDVIFGTTGKDPKDITDELAEYLRANSLAVTIKTAPPSAAPEIGDGVFICVMKKPVPQSRREYSNDARALIGIDEKKELERLREKWHLTPGSERTLQIGSQLSFQ